MAATAGTVKGTITDRQTKEPLTGATVQVSGTAQGAVADLDGNYTLELKNGTYTLTVRYIGYKDMTINAVEIKGETVLNFDMEPDTQTLGEVQVTAKKNLEGERALQMERQKATLAIENLGSKEMSLKGIGNVEEGVKKITGISIASAGQLIVRGLGDRYSTTTLNGLPIASPNPDNKLVPLDLFPSSTVQNITVSKVYDAAAFADYSGAHINISTKENIPEDFFQLSLNTGGKFNTLGKDRYQMDRSGSLLKTPGVDAAALDMPLMEFDKYVKTHNIFDTSFAASKKSSLPELGGNLGFGKNFGIGNQTLSLLASFSASNGYQNMEDAFYKTLEATGTVQDDFSYDSFAQELKLAALGYLGYTLRRSDRIGYTFFYARNAIDTYQRREGTDAEGHELTGSNNIMHIYTLQNHQLNGIHNFGEGDRWQLTWGGSYSKTGSEEPDRRQVMYVRQRRQSQALQTEPPRDYALLRQPGRRRVECQPRHALEVERHQPPQARLQLQGQEPRLQRYPLLLQPEQTEPRHHRHLQHRRLPQPAEHCRRTNRGTACDAAQRQLPRRKRNLLRLPADRLLSHRSPLGEPRPALRNEQAMGALRQRRRRLVLPSAQFRQERPLPRPEPEICGEPHQQHPLLCLAHRHPSLVHRDGPPFLYQESYGSAQIRGNDELQNGYNYNFDLRYERFGKNGDMISLTGYFKYLDSPIERIQDLQGGATLHSFKNADNGMAAGVELEMRKRLVKDLRLGANISYMYTNVKLPQGGAYTNKERSLQGASPILANADLTYSPRFGEERQLNLALLYNLQGSRIHAVGVSGLGDVRQQTLHTLNFSAGYSLNKHFNLKLQVNDLLNRDVIFKQDVPTTGQEMEVERYRKGTNFEVGISYNL